VVWNLAWARDMSVLINIHTGSGADPAFYSVEIRDTSWGKVATLWGWLFTSCLVPSAKDDWNPTFHSSICLHGVSRETSWFFNHSPHYNCFYKSPGCPIRKANQSVYPVPQSFLLYVNLCDGGDKGGVFFLSHLPIVFCCCTSHTFLCASSWKLCWP
jgi:hypothetical protein